MVLRSAIETGILTDVLISALRANIEILPDPPVSATAFRWRSELSIPPRKWLYGHHLLRKFLSVDVAAGGIGKSSLKIGEALAMASNREIYGKQIFEGPLRVWIYNLEDPLEETERRIHATAKRFNLVPEDFGDRLYMDSGRDQPVVLAFDDGQGARINMPVRDALISELKSRKIDVLIIDPFVSSHTISENDNVAIDMVAKQWGAIANECNCSINLIHHIRKTPNGEATSDSARGASSLIGAARSVMVFNRMSKDEASKAGIDESDARFFFRVDNDKANLAPPGGADWYRMNNVELENGDNVGVACPFHPTNPFDGLTSIDTMRVQKEIGAGNWRENHQCKDWVGVPVALALRLDVESKKDRARIKKLIETWIVEGVLEVVTQPDKQRVDRKYVIVGDWVTG